MADFPNRIAALVQFLKDDPTVSGMVTPRRGNANGAPRIYPQELLDTILGSMPTACIVVRDAPGGGSIQPRSYIEHSDTGVDIRHYGWTFDSARDLYMATTSALKQLTPTVKAQTLIHWANKVSGPLPLRDYPLPAQSGDPVDREHYWPFYVASWHVYAADVLATAA